MIIIYLPAFNEEDNIATTINKVKIAVKNIPNTRILVVNDGSTDRTATIAEDNGALVINHNRNSGVGYAFQSALVYSLKNDVDILISIDADGQFNPAEIEKLISLLNDSQPSMVTGNRFHTGRPTNMPLIKYFGNIIVSQLVSSISNQLIADVSCGFRAYNREALLNLNLFGDFTYTHETILDLVNKNASIQQVPISVQYFTDRKSKVANNVFTYACRTLKIIFRVMIDYKALKFFSMFSIVFLFIGSLFEAYLLIHYAISGMFTPYKAFGFIGLGFIIFGLFILLFSLIADMINRLKMNQERILYYLKNMNEKNNE